MFAGIPSDIPGLLTCARCQKRPGSEKTSDRNKKTLLKPFLCDHHGWGRHETKDCVKNNQEPSKVPSTPARTPPKINLCWNNGCNEEFTPQHRDVCQFKKKPAFRQMEVESEPDLLCSDEDESPLFAMLESSKSSSNFLYAPVLLGSTEIMAGIDSMANLSFISPGLAETLKLDVHPAKGQIKLGSKDSTIPRMGKTGVVEVTIGTKKFNHVFEVLELNEDCGCIFGMDILPKAGISISGIPAAFPEKGIRQDALEPGPPAELDSVSIAKVPEAVDTSPFKHAELSEISGLIDSINKTDRNYLTVYTVYLIKLMELLHPLLDRNERIKGFCNLQQSKVKIDVGSSKPINKRQYRIAFHLQHVVDDQIKDWLETAIVEFSPKPTSWNNPIMVVPKLDSGGSKKGWRICIDPRPLNLLIPEISFPLPLIRDIFESMKGCQIFTRIDLKGGFNQFVINPECREYTTFTWKGKQYQFQGAPFGFKHLPAMFQKVISDLF